MKVTWIGHACVLVQTGQVNAITDPWLVDPVFGGSTWHVPPRKHTVADLPPLDLICITHAHLDHFNEPTLRQLNKEAIVVIPRARIRPLRKELEIFGFKKVVELKDWESFSWRNLKVTAIPSVGIPEEIAFIFESEGHAVFDGADCYFDPIAERIGKRFKLDVGFIPYCGWDYAGLLGLEQGKKWEPDYQSMAEACRKLGIRYVIPSASNAYWYPVNLDWMNDRVCPGKSESFLETLKKDPAGPIGLAMEPGDGWDIGQKKKIPSPLTPHALPPPAPFRPTWLTPQLEIWSPERLNREIERFMHERRSTMLRAFWTNPKFILGIMQTRFEVGSVYEGKSYFWRIHLTRRRPAKRMEHDPSVHFGIQLFWEDLCAITQGLTDCQELTNSSRIRVIYLRKSEYFPRVCALEYLLYSRRLGQNSRMRAS